MGEAIFVGVHPVLAAKVNQVLAAMAILGYPMRAYQGVRTVAQQQALYAQGRTLPGPHPSHQQPFGQTVTDCDGVRTRSNHQPAADGLGHALDCCAAGALAFPPLFPWPTYGACCEAVGLKWGGRFPKVDLDHAELPA